MIKEERDKAIRILQWLHNNNFLFRSTEEDVKFATEYAIKALEQQDILDKIRSEIEEHAKINQNLNIDRARALCWCLDIIDKYKSESEE